MPPGFVQTVTEAPLVLGQGSVLERLNRMESVVLDPHVGNAALVYDAGGSEAMAGIYRQYLDIGHQTNLPMLLTTPTWRANKERAKDAGLDGQALIRDAVAFSLELREDYGLWGKQVFVGGLLACRGDAYQAGEALSEEKAVRFHEWQAACLARSGIDYLRAATLPALSEALGIARAFAATGLPYVISFVIRKDGRLLDGTTLDTAIATIDDTMDPPPVFYALNCVHPATVVEALTRLSPPTTQRLWSLLGNASQLSPEQLDCAPVLMGDAPDRFGAHMGTLYKEHKMRILGGCCGTDARHIQAIVDSCSSKA